MCNLLLLHWYIFSPNYFSQFVVLVYCIGLNSLDLNKIALYINYHDQ